MLSSDLQGSSSKPGQRGRRLRRGGAVRLGFLLRLRVRLFGLARLLVRCLEELKCCPGGRYRSTPRASRPRRHGAGRALRPAPAAEGESSFYAEAIADCLEFIKRSSYIPPRAGRQDGR